MGNDRRAIVAIKLIFRQDQTVRNLRRNFPFKNRCILSFQLNFWSIREEIKRILRKVLSDPLRPRV